MKGSLVRLGGVQRLMSRCSDSLMIASAVLDMSLVKYKRDACSY